MGELIPLYRISCSDCANLETCDWPKDAESCDNFKRKDITKEKE